MSDVFILYVAFSYLFGLGFAFGTEGATCPYRAAIYFIAFLLSPLSIPVIAGFKIAKRVRINQPTKQ